MLHLGMMRTLHLTHCEWVGPWYPVACTVSNTEQACLLHYKRADSLTTKTSRTYLHGILCVTSHIIVGIKAAIGVHVLVISAA